MTLCGGINTQTLLPYGTPEEIREEVKKVKYIMGEGGGYILEPGITIQDGVPLENILSMLDEAKSRQFENLRMMKSFICRPITYCFCVY